MPARLSRVHHTSELVSAVGNRGVEKLELILVVRVGGDDSEKNSDKPEHEAQTREDGVDIHTNGVRLGTALGGAMKRIGIGKGKEVKRV